MRISYLLATLALLMAIPLPASAQNDDGEPTGEPADGEADGADDPGFPPPPEQAGEPTNPIEPPVVVDLARPSSALYAEGYELFADGSFEVAALYFEEVLRRKPDHPSARNYLVECFLATGREQDAQAVREGALPPGEATPVGGRSAAAELKAREAKAQEPRVEPEREPEEELSEEERKNRRNPRRLGFASLGLQVGGPALGVGLHMEFKPGWFFAVAGGVGGVAVISDRGRGGIGAGWIEVAIRPIPIRVTPELGVGVAVFGGSDAWRLDTFSRALLGQGRFRVSSYILIGVRYDARKNFFLSGGVRLFPTGQRPAIFLPYPSARIGFRF